MPAFILSNLALCYLVQTDNLLQDWLTEPVTMASGLLLMLLSVFGGALHRLSTETWSDWFVVGSLVAWFAYWRPLFQADAPMFYIYPWYFTGLTITCALLLTARAHRFDYESVQHLRFMEKKLLPNIWVMAVLVLVSIFITRHYTLYPMMTTVFVVRYMLKRSLEIAER